MLLGLVTPNLRIMHQTASVHPHPRKGIMPRLQEDKQSKMPSRAFPLNLRPSWQLNKFLPSRGMEQRLETELSIMGILETTNAGEKRHKEETLVNVSY